MKGCNKFTIEILQHALLIYLLSILHLTKSSSISIGRNDFEDVRAEFLQKENGNCTQEMFPIKSNSGKTTEFDKAALLSCQAQYALQRNWYPDPIGGLFSYQTWNGMDGFWQNGVAVEALTNAMIYGNHSRYLSVVKSSLRELSDLLLAYAPQPSFDDVAWYGLAYLRVYEMDKTATDFFRVAKDIYRWIWVQGWDESVCNGGVWFDLSDTRGKNTIENAQVFLLALKLARLQKELENRTAIKYDEDHEKYNAPSRVYLHQAQLVWNFIHRTELIDPKTFQVYDGLNLDTCKAIKNATETRTYNAGVLVGGLIELSKIEGHQNHSLELAHNISSAVLKYMTKSGVLTEHCDLDDSCDLDANSFKGIFVRNLRYLIDEEFTNGRARNCNFSKMHEEKANRMRAANISKDVSNSNDLNIALKPLSNEICHQISTYKGFLERNIDVVLSNASCIPRESLHSGNTTTYNDSARIMVKEKQKSLSLSSKDDCHIIYLDGPPSYNKTGPVFGSAWYKPVKEARPEAQVSVLELFTAGIHLNVSCVGKACTYDPPTPPPKHLTCKDNPCPTGQECCKYPDTDSYTCCAPNQKCSYGYCD